MRSEIIARSFYVAAESRDDEGHPLAQEARDEVHIASYGGATYREEPEAEMPPAYRFIVGGFKYLCWPAAELAFHFVAFARVEPE